VKTDEIRSRFLGFFEKRNHRIIASDSLIPHNDPTLLFTGAGMNQFKEQFLGMKPLGFNRVATCQKCLRTGDLDNVGVTRWHMTLFEMLGNFSFGDYFKKDACAWAWQFMLEEMKQRTDLLHVTVYEKDDETYEIWNKEIGVAADHIWRFDEKSNFWPESAPSKGPNGPCGPCTEILIDTGVSTKPDSSPANDSSRFVEVWNLVLQQFDRQEGGKLVPLPSRNIDTGMGLERMAAIMQGVPSAQDIDLMLPIVQAAAAQTGCPYSPGARDLPSQRLRRIAEHVRAVSFCIAGGALPGNVSRGYVVRKLIRRAALDGRMLGLLDPFLYKLVPVVEQTMGRTYPEITQRKSTIVSIVEEEEKRFAVAADEGSPGVRKFKQFIESHYGPDHVTREGVTYAQVGTLADAMFACYDTHGVPLEYMEQILAQKHITYDAADFEKVIEEQRAQSRAGSSMGQEAIVFKREFLAGKALDRLRRENPSTGFVGYESTEREAKILAIFVDDECVETAEAGAEAQVLLDRTPFYARSGGQVGDVGRLESATASAAVVDTILDHGYLVHLVKIEKGHLEVHKPVRARVDPELRLATARNHTATHLLQWALRQVLGDHVHQAGSEVSPDRMRFDFTHPTALSADERRKVEDLVNWRILAGAAVNVVLTTLDEARRRGAMALFGEKYGDEVRLVNIGDFSMELCGGTHLDEIDRIGLFKIVGEESVAAGVRRITAVSGTGALAHLHEEEDRLAGLCKVLKAGPDTLAARVENLQKEIKDLRKQLSEARSVTKRSGGGLEGIMEKLQEIDGIPVVVAEVEGADANALREACDAARQKHPTLLLVLASREGEKVNLIAAASKDLLARGIHAGNLVRDLAKSVGGGGGGRPDLGQAGGKDPAALPGALAKVPDLVRAQLAAKK
jgi:alanyl-tRNA synthetase